MTSRVKSQDDHASLNKSLRDLDGLLVAGVDEVGRGPLAGDVVAAAVVLPRHYQIPGIADSKKLTAVRREALFDEIDEQALAVGVGRASVEEIDTINILQASLLAMQRAVSALKVEPEHILVDGNRLPQWNFASTAVIGGDALVPAISAASIVAKVTRDREMEQLGEQHPEYGFEKHKGYGTQQHRNAIEQYGPTSIHRHSFAPIRKPLL